MARCASLVRLAISLLAVAGAAASAQPVRVTLAPSAPAVDGRVEVTDGRPTTVPLLVENTTDTTVSLQETADVTAGWGAEVPEGAFELAPRERVLRLVTVYAPDDALVGVEAYALTYTLIDQTGAAVTTPVPLSVPARVAVEVGQLFLPAVTSSGEPIQAKVTLTNSGNVTDTVRVALRTSSDLRVEQDSVVYRLRPGEVRAVPVRIYPPPGRRTAQGISVSADVYRGEATDRMGRARSQAYVIPESPRRGLVYHAYPVVLEGGVGAYQTTALTAEEGDQSGLYFRASGQGALREGGDTTLRFEVEPVPYNPTGFGIVRDRYFAQLEAPRYEALAGDAAYSLSPLLRSAFGFGAAGEVRPGPVRVRGLFLRDRFDDSFIDRNFVGGGLGLDVTDRGEVFANVLDIDGLSSGQAYTGGVVFGANDPFGQNRIVAEAGVGVDDSGGESFGGSFQASLSKQSLSAAITLLEQGSSFPGLSSNRFYGTASFRRPLSDKITLRGNARYSRRGTFSSLVDGRPFYSESARLSGTYGRSALRLLLQHRENGSTRDVSPYRLTEDYLEAETTWRRGPLSLSALGSVGYAETETDQATRDFFRLGIGAGASATIAETSRLSINAEYTRGGAFFLRTDVVPERYRLNGSVAVSPIDRLTLNATVSATASSLDFDTRSVGVTGRSSYLLPWGHSLRLEGSYRTYAFESRSIVDELAVFTSEFETASVLASYVVPIGIPLHRSATTGLVRGQVVDASTGEPVLGTAVFLERDGRRIGGAYTGDDGAFYISEVTPGPSDLVVDTRTTGLGYIVEGGDRRRVTVEGGQTVDVSLAALPGASVRLRVVEVDSVRSPVSDEVRVTRRGVGQVRYQVAGNGETVGGATNALGESFVGRLTPGSYRVRLLDLPSSLVPLTPADTAIALSAGLPVEIDFFVQRQRRPVRFVDAPPLSVSLNRSGSARPASTSLPATRLPSEPPPPRPAVERVLEDDDLEDGAEGDAGRTESPVAARLYTVRPGDYLVRIARRLYGSRYADAWVIIYEANLDTIDDPLLIQSGQVLRIPPHPRTVDVIGQERP